VIFLFAFSAGAVSIGEFATFNVDTHFEKDEKSQTAAVLVRTSPNLYVYMEKSWWDSQVPARQTEILQSIDSLSVEFSNVIYPTLTSVFGSEWNPGVDGDSKITLLFHSMKQNAAGYVRTADEYLKLQIPDSNEGEMVYLSLANIDDVSKLKVFLAHEFVHLITFNQKDRLRGVQEDIWLNETRAEYAVSLLGYNNQYEGSNLATRVKDFLEKPTDSLVEWQNTKYDYGVVNVFTHYLVDHYGINILSDSLQSNLTGIASINKILQESGYQEDFAQIFTNWTISLIINNCAIDSHYCYLNKNLASFKINPALVFLPVSGSSSLSLTNVTKNWSGNWQKIIGGNGNLTLKFSSLAGLNFKVPYLVVEKNGASSLKFLTLNDKQEGEISLADFDTKYSSLVIMPSLQTKLSQFSEFELTHPYTVTISIDAPPSDEEQAVIQSLLDQIESLKKQIAELQAHQNPSAAIACTSLNNNLYVGVSLATDVRCLQQFLKNQGGGIYPEGLVTGTFGNLTKNAVLRFQRLHSIVQTGFVGPITRAKINAILP